MREKRLIRITGYALQVLVKKGTSSIAQAQEKIGRPLLAQWAN